MVLETESGDEGDPHLTVFIHPNKTTGNKQETNMFVFSADGHAYNSHCQ